MANIYVSFSPYIAKVLRQELSTDGGPCAIPSRIRSDNYWRKNFPKLFPLDIKKKPSLRELFLSALRVEGCKKPYLKAYSEEEYNGFPDSEDKRNELVAFMLPKVLMRNYATFIPNGKTQMEQYEGSQFRQAAIFHFYDLLSMSLHTTQMECMKCDRPFNICEAIHLFAEEYNLTSTEEDTLRRQYYRFKRRKKL